MLLALSLPGAGLAGQITDCPRDQGMPAKLRTEHYRRTTPSCVPGGITVDTEGVDQLLAEQPDTLLIDVWAILLRTEAGFGSEWLPNEIHLSLPGAVWLPNVGYGELKPPVDSWFTQQLSDLTDGNPNHPMVFYCVADCWMSWNAAQRARDMGYSEVYWYRLGTDGWLDAGRPLVPVQPQPID